MSLEIDGVKFWLMKNGKWRKEKDPTDHVGWLEDNLNRMILKNPQKDAKKYLDNFEFDRD